MTLAFSGRVVVSWYDFEMRASSGGLQVLPLLGFAVLGWWTTSLGFGNTDRCPLDLVNLAFHEAGHLFLTPFGETAHFLGGSMAQLAVPGLLIWYFLFRHDNRIGAAFSTWWIGESLVNVSVYMADARTLLLPLLGGGVHDWNWLFYRFNLLDGPSVRLISSTTRLLGTAVMIVGLIWWSVFVLSSRDRVRLYDNLAARSQLLARILPEQ